MTNKFKTKPKTLPEKFPTREDIIKHTLSVNKRASEIGRKTTATASKLKELTELVKSRNPFGDPTEKIERLTEIVTIEINGIKKEIEDLERFIGRSKGNKQTSDHSATLIRTLNTNLLHTTKELNDALELRTQNLKAQQDRIYKLPYGSKSGPAPIFRPTYDDEDSKTVDGEVVIAVPALTVEDDMVLQRANAVRDIADHINQIQTIFKRIAELVSLETEQLQRLEDIHDQTAEHAESALSELLKYLKGLSNERWLYIKAFLIVFFFLFVWFLFFA
jgi:DNA-binding ferritin-like protein